jgi:hypothetical protein
MEDAAQQDARAAEHDERPAPSIALADEAGEEAARDRADVDAGLMQSHGARAGLAAMIIADQGHRCGEVEGLAQAFGGAESEKLAEGAR